MKIKNIDDVIKKVDTLRESIKMSDEILPLVSDMFVFIKDVIPLLLEANAFMKDGTNKIPTAAENIQNVSKTTELATHEVLDKLDTITAEMETLKENLQAGAVDKENIELLENVQNQTSEIVYAFQFQDITSQQLEHVVRILQAIYDKFLELFESSLKMKGKTILGGDIIQAIEMELGVKNRQEMNRYFEERTKDKVHQTNISQDMIDNLFT